MPRFARLTTLVLLLVATATLISAAAADVERRKITSIRKRYISTGVEYGEPRTIVYADESDVMKPIYDYYHFDEHEFKVAGGHEEGASISFVVSREERTRSDGGRGGAVPDGGFTSVHMWCQDIQREELDDDNQF